MNAVAIEIEQIDEPLDLPRLDDATARVESLYRALHGRERSVHEAELDRWGEWWESRKDFTGHAAASSIAAFTDGAGRARAQSRILCKDMPKGVYWTNQAWLTLELAPAEVIWNHYIPRLNPETGRCLTEGEKADFLGISIPTYRVRLHRARAGMYNPRRRMV
jgi:hypothetical protein